MGVNSYDRENPLEKYMREALCFPIYDAGNIGMQRRKVHGVMAHDSFNTWAFLESEPMTFTKAPSRPGRDRTGASPHRPGLGGSSRRRRPKLLAGGSLQRLTVAQKYRANGTRGRGIREALNSNGNGK